MTPCFRAHPCHPWLLIISRLSLDFATNGSRRLVFEIDCKGTTQNAFSPNVARIIGYKTLQLNDTQRIVFCKLPLKIGYNCLKIGYGFPAIYAKLA